MSMTENKVPNISLCLSQETLKKINSSLTDLIEIFKEEINFKPVSIDSNKLFNAIFQDYNSSLSQFKELLEAGANPNIQDQDGGTPLHYVHIARWAQNAAEPTKLLLEAGANINIQDEWGCSPLHFATTKEQTKLLLEAGANPNIQDKNGETPLHYSCFNSEKIKLLLEAGADYTIKNKKGLTPKDYYLTRPTKDSIKIIDDFIKLKEELKLVNSKKLFDTIFQDSNSSLSQFKELLEAGANPNIQDKYGCTPLHYVHLAREINNAVKLTKLLLKAGANINIQDNIGFTPLHSATSEEQTKLLLESGANPNIQTSTRKTPLHLTYNIEKIKLLLEAGADYTIKDWEGNTPREVYKNNCKNSFLTINDFIKLKEQKVQVKKIIHKILNEYNLK